MLTQDEKISLIKSFRSVKPDRPDALAYVLDLLTTDVLDGGRRFEDMYIATMSHYGSIK